MLFRCIKREKCHLRVFLKRNFSIRRSFVAYCTLLLFSLNCKPTIFVYGTQDPSLTDCNRHGLCVKLARMSKREADLCDQQHDCITPFRPDCANDQKLSNDCVHATRTWNYGVFVEITGLEDSLTLATATWIVSGPQPKSHLWLLFSQWRYRASWNR